MTATNARDAIKDLMSKFASSGADFFTLKNDGDKATVRFGVSDENDLLNGGTGDSKHGFIHPIHEFETGGKTLKVRCLDSDKCPFCLAAAAGAKNPTKTSLKVFIPLITKADNAWKWWERGQTMIGQLLTFIDQRGPLCNRPYDVIRSGKAGDKNTSYTMLPDDKDERTVADLGDRPQLLTERDDKGEIVHAGLVKDWTADEMVKALNGQSVGTGDQPQGAAQQQPPGAPTGGRRVPF